MFSSHVARQFSAYYHAELSPEESRRVAEHLIGCTRCRAEFEEIRLGAQSARHLPLVAAPDSIWPGIETALRQHPGALPYGRASDTARYLKPSLAFAAGFMLLFIAGVFLLRHRTAARPLWEVARRNGAPASNGNRIKDSCTLAELQRVETYDTSFASIDMA